MINRIQFNNEVKVSKAQNLKYIVAIIMGTMMSTTGILTAQNTDGLQDWDKVYEFPSEINFEKIHFLNADAGWVVGFNGVFNTKDGGENWVEKYNLIDNAENQYEELRFRDVYFRTILNGWIVATFYADDSEDNSLLLETKDGGESWNINSEYSEEIKAVEFHNENIGWFTTDRDEVYKTSNGGLSWVKIFDDAEYEQDLDDVSFSSSSDGWSVSSFNNHLYRTSDGGESWSQYTSVTNADRLHAIHFFDSDYGWVSGSLSDGGYGIWSTEDGGASWTLLATMDEGINDLQILSSEMSIATDGRKLLSTSDSGATFTEEFTSSDNVFLDLHFFDGKNGIALNYYGKISKTIDGGITWENKYVGENVVLFDLHFINNNQAWALGEYDGIEDQEDQPVILTTSDGGNNWVVDTIEVEADSVDGYYSSLHFTDENNGWIFGNYYDEKIDNDVGVLLNTSDGGSTWNFQKVETGWTNRVWFSNEETGWLLAGDKNQIMKTTDGGQTWEPKLNQQDLAIIDIDFADNNIGWAVGISYGNDLIAQILKTEDGGETWQEQTVESSFNQFEILDVEFIDELNGWAVGYNFDNRSGIILTTTDGGENWEGQITNSELYTLFFLDANTGWIGGEDYLMIYNS
ncbi:MAG: YCF48-related protein, partial [Gracilimonas sp.]